MASNLEVVATVGWPCGNAGWLVPIVADISTGTCYQAGDGLESGFLLDTLNGRGLDQPGVRFKPISLDPDKFPKSDMLRGTPGRDKFDSPAFVFYLNKPLADILSELDRNSFCFDASNSISCEALENFGSPYYDYRFFLVAEHAFVNDCLPKLFAAARSGLRAYFKKRLKQERIARTAKDSSDLLAELIMVAATDKSSTDEAIAYAGLAVITGPQPRNFTPWLEAVLHDLDLSPASFSHWHGLCLDVLTSVECSA